MPLTPPRVLLYGSSPLTEAVAKALVHSSRYRVVGHVSAKNPWLVGSVEKYARRVDPSVAHDIGLSVQYDRKLPVDGKTFNLHSGLLPQWGGCDILYHTLKEQATEQGLTFHRITETLDRGPTVLRLEYPVFKEDDVLSLYARMLMLAPHAALMGLELLMAHGLNADYPDSGEPMMYRRGQIFEADTAEYEKTGLALRRLYH